MLFALHLNHGTLYAIAVNVIDKSVIWFVADDSEFFFDNYRSVVLVEQALHSLYASVGRKGN